jgi:predicted RNA-binding Zn-ribbon protein involved in translation (DUF1610 family)
MTTTTTECRHLNWHITPENTFGIVTCKDCGKEIWATDALNNMSEYMSSLIRELEAIVSVEPKKPGRPKKNG